MIVTTGGRGCSVSAASTSSSDWMSTSAFADALDVVAEFGDQQLGGVLVDRLVDGDRHAHLEQRLHQIGAALGHAVGELADGDRLGHDDVADLLGRRAGLHMGALFLLAGALERGERAGAGAAVLVERAADGELAALAAMLLAAARRARAGSGRLAADGRGRGHGLAGAGAVVVLVLGAAAGAAASAGASAARFASSSAARRAASAAVFLGLAIFLGAALLVLGLRLGLLVLAAARLLERGAGALPRPRAAISPAAPCAPARVVDRARRGLRRGLGRARDRRGRAPRRARASAPRPRPGGRGCGAS